MSGGVGDENSSLLHSPILPFSHSSKKPAFFHFEIFIHQFNRESSGGNVERQSARATNAREGFFTLMQYAFGHALSINIGRLVGAGANQFAKIRVAYRDYERKMSGDEFRCVREQFC